MNYLSFNQSQKTKQKIKIEMKGEGKGWHFRRGKGMEENTRDRQEVGDIKKFFLELSLTHTHITHFWQGYLTIK